MLMRLNALQDVSHLDPRVCFFFRCLVSQAQKRKRVEIAITRTARQFPNFRLVGNDRPMA
jgi:hypothetical protein